MSAQDRVYERMFGKNKTELASQKVELGSVKEVNQAISILKRAEDDLDKKALKFEQSISDSIRIYNDMIQERNAYYTWAYNEAPARIEDLKAKAKEIGLNANDIPEIKELQKIIDETKKLIKAIDGYNKPKY